MAFKQLEEVQEKGSLVPFKIGHPKISVHSRTLNTCMKKNLYIPVDATRVVSWRFGLSLCFRLYVVVPSVI